MVLVVAGTIAALLFVRFAFLVHQLQNRRAVGPAWSFPSRVYSDGVALIGGREAPLEYLRAELDVRGYRQVPERPQRPGAWSERGDEIEIFLRGFLDAADPAGRGGPERVRLRIARGRIGAIERLGGAPGAVPPDLAHPPRIEPMAFASIADSSRMEREWVPLSSVPGVLRQAVIASEDRRFREHHGLDPRGFLRALFVNVRAGGVRQGASTITQQLARGLFLGSERNFGRKLQEAMVAVGLELLLPKDRILEMYLNSVYLGRDAHGGIAGVATASRRFFGVPVDSLALDQAALLVGIIPAPNAYSPYRNPAAALKRRRAVLDAMVETGVLAPAAALEAADRPLRLRRGRVRSERFPAFVGWLHQDAGRQLPKHALEGWGLSLFTTLDAAWQQAAEEGVASGLALQDPGRRSERLQGAFVLLDVATGEVRAMAGSRDPEPGEYNRATQARRQPGSSIKPIVYAIALDPNRSGPHFTPASIFPDTLRTFETGAGPWTPQNSSGRYHDSITLAKALALSQNVATANLVDSLGPPIVARGIERFGLGRPQEVLSLGLGTHEVSPLALVTAYAVFAADGMRREPTPLRAIVDGGGRSLRLRERRETRVLDETTAALVCSMLENVVRFGLASPLRWAYGFDRPVGAKTGTTNDNRDAWFVGVTPALAAGMWVGYDRPRPLPRTAASTALPVWARIMRRALAGFPADEFPPRSNIEVVNLDGYTGLKAGPQCLGVMPVAFRLGETPTLVCGRDHAAEIWALKVQALMDSLVAIEGGDSVAATGLDSLLPPPAPR